MSLENPLTAIIDITGRCNNYCTYCYNSWRITKNSQPNDLSSEKVLNLVKKIIATDVFRLTISGGEPLMRPQLVLDIIKEAKKNHVAVQVNTNAILLNQTIVRKIKDAGAESFFSSICSLIPEVNQKMTGNPNSLKDSIKGIKTLNKEQCNYKLNMVINAYNKDTIYESLKELKRILGDEIGNRSIRISLMGPQKKVKKHLQYAVSKENFFQILDQIRRARNDFGLNVKLFGTIPRCLSKWPDNDDVISYKICAAGLSMIHVQGNGDVIPCGSIETPLGNLCEEDLKQIWSKVLDWGKYYTIPKECMKCTHSSLCGGGCRARAYVTKSLKVEDPFMTEVIKESPKIKEGKIEDKVYSFTTKLIYRQQKDGRYCLDNGLILNHNDMIILNYLISLNSFIPSEVATKLNISLEELNKLLIILKYYHMID